MKVSLSLSAEAVSIITGQLAYLQANRKPEDAVPTLSGVASMIIEDWNSHRPQITRPSRNES